MLELMVLSEVTKFPTNYTVPLVNFYGNQFVIRPLIYFKEADVMLTTTSIVHVRPSPNKLNILGLIMIFFVSSASRRICHIWWTESSWFFKSQWSNAKKSSSDNYSNSKLIIGYHDTKRPHSNDKVSVCSSDFQRKGKCSNDSSDDDFQSEIRKRKTSCDDTSKSKKVKWL